MVCIVTGNILEADDRNIIIQQVNCQGAMNSGIAKQIRDRYPDVFTVYKEMCDAHKNNTSELLGKVCYCLTPEFMIINCFIPLFSLIRYIRLMTKIMFLLFMS